MISQKDIYSVMRNELLIQKPTYELILFLTKKEKENTKK